MKVIICGAGQVGFGIAERLAAEKNDVTVVDTATDLIQRVNDMLDARGIVGHGSHPDVLGEAGARDADMIIAVTLHDEVNMVACQVAHSLFGTPTKIARVRSQSYLNQTYGTLFTRDNMPIDVMISPEVEVGETVLRRLNQPGTTETIRLGDGKVSLVGVMCDERCPIVDTPLSQLTELFPDLASVIVGIVRGDTVFVPHSDDQLMLDDEVYFVARADQVDRTLKIFGIEEQRARRVVIAGGGNIGLYVAEAIERGYPQVRVKIIEQNRARAVTIAERLSRTVVLHGDALSEDLLKEAEVGQADTLLALTNDDQVNILACVLVGQLGTARTLCLLNAPRYTHVIRSLGIDSHVNPRATTVSRILQQVRRGRIRSVNSLQNGLAEVIEAEALDTAPVVGKALRDLDLPEGIRFGAILRKDDVIIPTGDTEIRAQDRAVIFALAENVRTVEHLFRVSVDFF
ncbi:MAG: Trk system potassium transporter TrkA [Rhizobiales bacterium]|nr:Trk system potassium transporter TrkA [Hyphomicrobiales bacterium]